MGMKLPRIHILNISHELMLYFEYVFILNLNFSYPLWIVHYENGNVLVNFIDREADWHAMNLFFFKLTYIIKLYNDAE